MFPLQELIYGLSEAFPVLDIQSNRLAETTQEIRVLQLCDIMTIWIKDENRSAIRAFFYLLKDDILCAQAACQIEVTCFENSVFLFNRCFHDFTLEVLRPYQSDYLSQLVAGPR